MVCLSCANPARGYLCPDCVATLHPAAERLLPDGIRLIVAFEHDGAARTLIHHLKYRGVTKIADLVADVLASQIPKYPLVPVPRALSRRVKYGVDPSREIARALALRMGVPLIDALTPPLHAPRRAGRDHSRPVHPFRTRSALRSPVILVDDVVTTGATVSVAANAIGHDMVRAVVAANVVRDVYNVNRRVTSPDPGADEVWQQF